MLKGRIQMKKIICKEFCALALIAIIVFLVYLYIESGKIHTKGITEGEVYLKYSDSTISQDIEEDDLEEICEILDGVKFSRKGIKAYADPDKQIILGDKIHLRLGGYGIFYYVEKERYICIYEEDEEQMKNILSKYGYKGY